MQAWVFCVFLAAPTHSGENAPTVESCDSFSGVESGLQCAVPLQCVVVLTKQDQHKAVFQAWLSGLFEAHTCICLLC